MNRKSAKACIALVALCGVAACAPPALHSNAQAACDLGSPTVLVETGAPHEPGSRLLQMWDVTDTPVLWSETSPETQGYQSFRAAVARNVADTDPVRLLAAAPTADKQLAANNNLVIASAKEWIRPAGCIEKYLQGVQHARMDTFAAPTEFAALILRSPDDARLRIYYLTSNADAVGRATFLTDAVDPDLAAGWSFLAGLHNHAFHPGQPALNGILAPSTADAHFNEAYGASVGMAEAWITNGVHTVRIPSSAFDKFEQQGPS